MKTFMFIAFLLISISCCISIHTINNRDKQIEELENTIQTQKQIIDFREQEIDVLNDEKMFLLNLHQRDSILYQQFINLKFDMP